VRFLREFRVFLGAKNNLDQPFAISQINKNYTAVIACDIYPAGQRHLFADVALAK
jgi:hypothetical protein